MTVIPNDECQQINDIIDYILVHTDPINTVGHIKEKFQLTDDEYDMIATLMMPALRWYNSNIKTRAALRQQIRQQELERERKAIGA